MKSKSVPFLIILALALVILFIKKYQGLQQNYSTGSHARHRGFDRTISTLTYTKHALCRMDCRHISKRDIQDIMRNGEVNYAKTNVNDQPCPTYAVQGYSNDGQYLRVIFAQCESNTKVVTCYDLENDFECHCPGDEKKKVNQ